MRPHLAAPSLAALCLGLLYPQDFIRTICPALADDEVPDGFEHTYVRYVDGPTDLEWLPGGQFGPWGDNGKRAMYYATRVWGGPLDVDGIFS